MYMESTPPIDTLMDAHGVSVASYLEKYEAWKEDYQPVARYDYASENYDLLHSTNHNTIWTKVSTLESDELLEKGLLDYGDPDPKDPRGKFTWEWIVCEVPWGHDTESPLNISPTVRCWSCSPTDKDECNNCKGFRTVVFYFEENEISPQLGNEEIWH